MTFTTTVKTFPDTSSLSSNRRTGMNNDYPIIQATAVMAEAVVLPPASGKTTAPRPGLKTNGRSSRVMLPKQRSYAIQNAEIERLQEQGFTKGLAETLTKNNAMFPLRIWVVDNSGSMNRQDGHRIIETFRKDNVKLVDCTRWAEIQQTVEYHAQMSALVKAPTVFRLLNDPGRINGPQQFSIAEHHSNSIDHDLSVALQTMKNSSPGGATPLTEHIQEIRANLVEMEPTLRRDGSRVAIILATDGLPSSIYGVSDNMAKQEFVRSLRSLEGLPVWVVVRLCTDDEEVVQFYNDLDSQLELSLEVLDDFVGEAEEVYEHNKWLNYALPLHRLREMGYHNRLFDLLDERQLTPDELKEFMRILFGKDAFDGVPDPQADWVSFRKSVEVMLRSEKNQWNPIRKKVMPWIDIKKLEKSYKTKGCSIM